MTGFDHSTTPRRHVLLPQRLLTVAVATTFFVELGLAHLSHIVALIIGGVLAAPLGAVIARFVPAHRLMAIVGVLVCILALVQIALSVRWI